MDTFAFDNPARQMLSSVLFKKVVWMYGDSPLVTMVIGGPYLKLASILQWICLLTDCR